MKYAVHQQCYYGYAKLTCALKLHGRRANGFENIIVSTHQPLKIYEQNGRDGAKT